MPADSDRARVARPASSSLVGRLSSLLRLLCVVALAAALTPASAHAATGLVAGYAFSEGSGPTTADASGNGITGTLVNGPAWVGGKNGTGLSFNGSSTYVDLGNPVALGFTGSMTLSGWVYETANVGDDGQIVAKSDGGSGWQLKSTPDTGQRTFGIAISNASGVPIQRYSSTVRALNTWYHVTGVYDATARTLNIYVNGVLNNGVLSGTVPTSQRASPVAANIGRRTGGFNIQGIVDDVRVYGRALTVAEIQADMAAPVGGAAGDTTPPTAPTNLTATAVSSSQINLSWTASTDNVAVTGYRVERCQGQGCASFAQIATPTGTTYNDTGRTANTTYSYRVRASDAVPNLSAYSNTASATTPAAADTTPPTAPTNLTATAVSSTQINLSWTASTDNVAVTGYRVERCQGAGCVSFAQIAAPTGTGTTYNDTGRTPNTSYSYRVRASDAVPNLSAYSNTASATTPAVADTTPPTAPTNLTATAVSSSQINLSWTASTDNVAVTGYLVERCQGSGCTTFAQIATPGGTTYSDVGRTAATSYSYRVRASDAVPNLSGYSNTASATTPAVADTTPPTAPTNLTATAVSSSQINLSWTASTDNVAVTGYLVERCQGSGCTTFAQIATPTGTTHNDTGRTANTSYSYRVRASDAVPNLSAYSNTASATTSTATGLVAGYAFAEGSGPTTADASGNGITGTLVNGPAWVGGKNGTGLSFNGSSTYVDLGNPVALGFTGSMTLSGWVYETANVGDDGQIVAKSDGGSGWQLKSTPDTGQRTFGIAISNASGVPIQRYSSTVRALNTWYHVTGVYDATARTLNIYVNGVLNNGVLSGTVPTSQRASPVAANIGRRTGGFNIQGIVDDVRVYGRALTVAEIQADMAAPVGGAAGDTTPPTAPTNLTATAVSSSQINLSWTASTDNVAVTGYLVERCQGSGCTTFAQIATPTGTTYNDTGRTANTSYSYRVRASDAVPNLSGYSNTASATTPAAADTTPPSAPTNLTATAVSSSQINLSWTASTDNVAVTGYLVERCQGSGCTTFAQIATPTGTTYNDTGRTANTSYSYRVRASDAVPNLSAYSNTASATTPAVADTTPPTAPTNLTATAVSSSQINLSWTASTDNVAVTGYLVERCQGAGCTTFALIATPGGTTYSDVGRTAATSYSYRVRASDAVPNLSGYSNTASATTTASSGGAFVNEILISGMDLPTAVKFLPDGSMLILELGGNIWKADTTTWQVSPTPFLTLTNIGSLNSQQGLMELVLDPAFTTNRFYYVFYTRGSPNRDRVSRFTATADLSGTVAGSEFVLYQDPQDANVEHHGGAMNFGNDGKLYVTTGEHFNPGAAQDLSSPRGKILRINTDGTVPTDNPFYDGGGPNYDAIWALGLRNPYRASYDTLTGRLYIGDVGGNVYSTAREELNVGAAGANYGWPNCEGFSCTGNPTYTNPLYDYGHAGRDAAITGGFVYRGSQFPAQYYGNYFFADYAQNWIKRLTLDPVDGHVTGLFNFEPADGSADGPSGDIVQLLEGPDGALYYVDLGYSDTTFEFGISKIRRIRFISSNQPPVVVAAATSPTNGPPPLSVNFSSAGTSDPEGDPLSYSWNFGDSTTSTLPNPSHTYTTRGQYSARLTVSDGTNSTLSAPITIRVGNSPVPTIASPADGSFFRAGDTIAFSGNATDVEDGVLPASAFSWSIDFLHEGHVHPGVPQTGTKSGTFVIPTTGHDFHGNTRYRITLTVTDSDGLQSSQAVFIWPQKVNVTLDTVPSGLTLTLDGLPLATPIVYDTLIGYNHQVEAADQSIGTDSYTFTSWSDGGAQNHIFVVPATDSSLVATYSVSSNPLPSGLVAGYRFGEGSGNTTADLSGNGNTGTLVNGPTWTAGPYGSALAFDGVSHVSLGNGPSLQLTGSMTLTAWIRISANPFDDGAIVAKLAGAGWQLKTSADTGVRTAAIQISSDGGDAIQRYSGTVLAVGTWYHVAGVYDAVSRTLSIYVNGILDNGVLTDVVPAAQFNAPFEVNIAQRTGIPGTFNFLGTIDEVHVFNRALTAAEIQTDMTVPR